MLTQHPVWQIPMGYQVNGTIVAVQQLLRDFIGIMVVEMAIDIETGNGFHIRGDHAQVMRHQDNSDSSIQLQQGFIKVTDKTLVDKGVRFVQYQ